MAVNPSRNNKFGGRSLVSDIAGVGSRSTSNKRAMSAADIIKKQQEAVAKAEAAAEETVTETVENVTQEAKTAETTTEEKPIETPKEPVNKAEEDKKAKQTTNTTIQEPVVESTSAAAPVTSAPAATPVTSAPAAAPVTSAPVATPVTSAPAATPVTSAPVATPTANAPETTQVTTPVAPAVQVNTTAPEKTEVNTRVTPATSTPAPMAQNIATPAAPTVNTPVATYAEQAISSPTTYVEPAKEVPVTNISQSLDQRNVVEPAQNYNYQQPYSTPQYNYAPQTNPYNNNGYGMNQNANFYGNYQDPYAQNTPNNAFPQDIQNAELHKTTNFNIFEDYPDINVRLPIKTGGDREMLKKSILESGIADPIIVAPVNDVIRAFQAVQFPVPNYPSNVQFIIIAGQNRRSIAKELNIELPFIIKRGLTKEQMDAIGLDTNLLNRQFSAMKPSEQVYIVNRRRALFEQNNTRNIRGKLSEITGYEKTYIYQLLSLVNVKRELLTDFVDPGYISVSGITHLVSVPFNNQELLYDYLIRYNIKKLMASQMKALLQDSTTEWNDTYLSQVLFPNTKRLSNITIRPDQYQNLIPEADLPKATEIIIQALKEYYKK